MTKLVQLLNPAVLYNFNKRAACVHEAGVYQFSSLASQSTEQIQPSLVFK